MKQSDLVAHGLAAVVFFGMAVLLSYPLVLHLGTHVPGANSSEDLKFLWNLWWFRTPGVWSHPFACQALFAPFGLSLVLDTHTAFPAIVGATLLRRLDVITAMNVVLLAGLSLNGWITYVLAYRQFHRVAPALLAGLVFGSSAYISIHFLGHFNLVHAWTLPLVVLVCDRLVTEPRWDRGIAAGLALAMTTYTDYYYAVYAAGLAICWLFMSRYAINWRIADRKPRALTLSVIAGLGVCVTTLMGWVVLTGGIDFQIAHRLVNLHDTRNMKTILWALLAAAVLSRWRVRGDIAPRAGAANGTALIGPLAVAVGVYVLLLIPLATAVWRLAASGDYVAVPIHWLSSAAGVDAATFVLGHPLHSWWWRHVQHLYSAFGIGMIENSGWIGTVPLVLLATASYRGRMRWRTSPWTLVGCAALLWSLGPFLTIAGHDTGLILPQAILRYVPVLSNARMPGRAFVIVELAVAMACAASVIHLRLRSGMVLGIACLVLLDSVTLPISLDEVRLPGTVEQTLADDRPRAGAVLELPIGVADGFGEIGKLDFRMLSSQMWHGRNLVGGFAGRVPERIKDAYLADPVFGPLFRLSSGEIRDASAVDWPPDSSHRLLAIGIRFLVINRDVAPPALVGAALAHISMRPLAADGLRQLYVLEEGPQ